TTEISTLSLHDALPILLVLVLREECYPALSSASLSSPCSLWSSKPLTKKLKKIRYLKNSVMRLFKNLLTRRETIRYEIYKTETRSEEHTSELQSRENLV